MKKWISLLLCLCLTTALLCGCGGGKNTPAATDKTDTPKPTAPQQVLDGASASTGSQIIESAKYKDSFTIGAHMSITSLDFQSTTDCYYVSTCVFDTLIKYSNGEYLPALATEWKNVGNMTWEFKLRDDVTFQNGDKFTADDVLFTLGERAFDVPGTTPAAKLDCLDKIEVVDPYTVRFILNANNQEFLDVLADPSCAMLSRKACEADPDKGILIGTGPWKVTNFIPGISVEMDRYDDFWGELPKPSKLYYVSNPDDSARLAALRSGNTDCCTVVNAVDNSVVENDPNIQAVAIRDSGVTFLGFNTTDPVCGDLNFRKAVAYAINCEDVIAASCEGLGETCNTLWGSGTFGEYTEMEGFHYDPELAKEYLAKSNYDGSTIAITAAAQEYVTNATVYADQLGEIGINCVVDERDFIGIIANASYSNPTHQLISWTSVWTSCASSCRHLLYPGENSNRSVVNDPYLTDLIDRALYEEDTAKRTEMYHEIQQNVKDNVYYVPVYRSIYYCAEVVGTSGIDWNSNSALYNFRYACIALPD